ncbi:dynein regulatory complex subunit 3 [Oryzias latipes]|uniref:Dynein regulatory complex subunit 3 n=1 Tax=Oryzias latipes TaxID=8090 RepID=A0A3B3HEB6_ORYLA|nr:dynein regulatory complex subunit 3 [Oryzias latipes]XP_020560998.1 dynein regulatory complex subunit 3 [Oryzias latipes]XP_020560999.1 dynein regulatory complex subunit 3 [Oryzias latipes]XP_020561000.1 dynein regulatory complex subunit 3 [Oryzias latipes]
MDPVPNRMNREMIQNAIEKNSIKSDLMSKEDNICLPEADVIKLEYQNIQRIDSLQEYTSLVRLDLNNNLIKKIQGLDSLINLTWLNLSFNRIEKIQGLTSLQKLKVLNLSNNQITVIENMDTLDNLTHFFIGCNLLNQLENVLYLKRFKKLVHIYMKGNLFSNEDDYQFFIVAFFPNLTVLDNKLILQELKEKASSKYQDDIEKRNQEESQKQLAEEVLQKQEAELNLHKEAFVEYLDGPHLFKSMFDEDTFSSDRRSVPGIEDLLQSFENQMVGLCKQLFDRGLAEREQRERELKSFSSSQDEVETHYKNQAIQVLEDFNRQHKERIKKLEQLTLRNSVSEELSRGYDEINKLSERLMTLEFKLISKLEENIRNVETCISDKVTDFIEIAQETFTECRNLEDDFHHKVQEIIDATLENVAKGSQVENLPHDVKMLFTDKIKVMHALNTNHKLHLLTLNDREQKLLTSVSSWKIAFFKDVHDKVTQQNRTRISDIHRYADFLRKQLERFH